MYIMYDFKINHYNYDCNILHCKQNSIEGFRKLSMHSLGRGDQILPPPTLCSHENPSEEGTIYCMLKYFLVAVPTQA